MKHLSFFPLIVLILFFAFAGCQKNVDLPTAIDSGANLDKADGGFIIVTESNDASGNEVVIYSRSHDGSLSSMGSYSTGGLGSGAGLGSQGAVVLSEKYIFAVNAGSNDISVLKIDGSNVDITDKESSGGMTPISLTVHGNILYVLNAGGDGNITGFSINRGNGSISPIPGSTQPLSGTGVGPAQVSFNSDGTILIVTEKATNMIDTYVVTDGVAGPPISQPSTGSTPFGFAFDNKGHIIISDAFGGGAGAGAMSSYNVDYSGVSLISGPVTNSQTAPCWVAITNNGKFSYTTNTGTGNISGYYVGADGSLTLFNDGGNTGSTGTGSSPIDLAINNNSQFLYALGSGTHTISVFRIDNRIGALTPIQTVTGLPSAAAGLAAK
jgi:6-phosphogluconolactonase (cycloisomerase 2 family)